ncbi:MAG TPA: FixH family protein, partial [Anaerolineales bacterium]|nr:FixH family protein [Anaerolineales bacterium]
VIASANSSKALADEGGGEHTLEMEVNGYHVTLASQNDWEKGENTIVVTLKDRTGLPVSGADVELLIGPQKADDHAVSENGHGGSEVESAHGASEAASAHGAEQGHLGMPGMEVDEPAAVASHTSAHSEANDPLALEELGEHGIYVAETHLESSGVHEINVMFHVNGEMLQASFIVEIPGVLSKSMVLWSFAVINVVLIAAAGIMKRGSIPAKGAQ